MNQFVILSFGVDPLNWPSFIEIGEIACSTPAWCTHGLTLKTAANAKILMFIEGDVGNRQMKSAIACKSTGRTCIQKAEKGHSIRMTRRGKQRVWVPLGRQ